MRRVHSRFRLPGAALGALLLWLTVATPGAAGGEAIRRQVRAGRPQSVQIDYVLPDPVLETRETAAGERFTAVKVAESGRSGEIGRPDLPTLVDDIAVARRGEIRVRLTSRGEKRLATPHWVYPVQESVPKLPGALAQRRFRLDEVWYRTAGRRRGAEVPFTTTTYTVRGQRYVRVQASPYAYDPVRKELAYPATVSLDVSVTEPLLPAAAGPRLGEVQVLRVPFGSRAELADLQARGLDIKTVRGDEAIVYATAAERESLERAGYSVELIEVQSGDPAKAAAKAISAGYHDWAQVQALMTQFASTYPAICRLETIGSSHLGRPILAIRITDNPGSEEAEPEVRIVGAIHGDEVVGTELSLRFIDHVLSGYASDSRIQTLVDGTDLWIVPVMNPDGFATNSRNGGGGYDLNRSFPDGSESYIGTLFGGPAMDTAGRPAETVAMMQWCAAHSFVLSATYHSGALVANYQYDNDGLGDVYSPTPDQDVFVWLAETYASRNAPMWASTFFPHGITNGADWYTVVGGVQDWLYRYLGCMDMTLEISNSDHPAASALTGLWDDNREAMLAYVEASHTGLCGVVTEAGSGLPLYASIAIQGRTPYVYCDPDVGDYYRLLRPGSYTVVVSAPGYQPQVLPDVVVGAGAATRLDVALQKTGSTGGTPLIVVYHADDDTAFVAYRDRKQAEGYAVTEVRVTGAPSAENVRTQIRAAYEATAARYVVILGDIEKVPTFTNSAYGTTARSDLAYALLDAGETFDDFLGKDVGIGRISLDSTAELLEYVAKLEAFTRGPRHRDLTWVSGGSSTWENDVAEGSHNYVMTNYIDSSRYHSELFYRSNGSAAELSAHIDAGTDAVVYSGHGSTDGWLRYGYDGNDISGLTNTLDVPIVLGHCCLTGSFQLDDCFAEQWLATKERAIAYVGASQNSLWDEDDLLQRREFQWLFEHPGGSLSEALDWGLRQTAAAYPGTAEYYFTIYHVFGDPTVRLFGLPLEITHEALADASQRAGPYVVEATVASLAAVSSVTLYWRTSPTAAFTAAPMAVVRGSAYRGSIPGQPYGTSVQYYLQATDGDGVTATHPLNAPAAWHAFRVDVLFAHTPQGSTADAVGPYAIRAGVSADEALTVTLHWAANGGAYTVMAMGAGAGSLFSGAIPGQAAGTTVSYYLTATTAGGYSASEPAGAPETAHQFLVDTQPPVFAGLDLAAAGDRSVVLSWVAATEVSGPVTYSIYRAALPGGQDFGAPLASSQGLTYTDIGLTNGVSYYYVVRARDALGNAETNAVELAATPRGPELLRSWSMDSDPGWAREGAWAYGIPRGSGGAYGRPDPSSGATGSAVFGYNLGGDYGNSMSERYLTTPAIDCSAIVSTELRFQRWLNVEQPAYDHATLEVSTNGSSWQRLWENTAEVLDTAWQLQTFDLSEVADGSATLYLRWGMGPTDGSWTYSGWNIDDVQIWGVPAPPPEYRLTLAAEPLGGGTLSAQPLPGAGGRYPAGTRVSLSAAAADGFVFVRWSGAAAGAVSPVEVVLDRDLAVTAVFAVPDTQAPEFAGLTGAMGADGRVTLSWDAATDASPPITYEVYRAPASGGQTFAAPVDTTQALTYVDTSVTNGSTYYYVVRAVDAEGNREANLVEQAATAGEFGCIRAWSLATDPGWRRGTPWAFGVPRGRGGRGGGFPDPQQGYTGSTVFGYNLGGDYRNNLMPRYLTSESLDCSRLSGTQLRYRRWLNVQSLPLDRAAVEVSSDGATWHTVWQNETTIQDAAWQFESIDISAYADGCPTLLIRWAMGPTDRSIEMSGWNLDDIEIWAVAGPARGLALAAAARPAAKGSGGRPRAVADSGWLWPLFVDGAFRSRVRFGVAPAAWQVEARRAAGGSDAWLRYGDTACATLVQESATAAEWVLEVVPGPALAVALSWAEPAGVPSGYSVTLIETDTQGGVVPGGLAVDLRREAGLTVPPGAARRFVIRYAPETSFELQLEAGWNLVSLPLSPVLPAAAAVFADAVAVAAQPQAVLTPAPAGDGYLPALVIQALRGYWVYVPAAARLVVAGAALSEPVLTLDVGWNLVGVPAALAAFPGAAQGVGPWLEYSPALAAFLPAGDLQPGLGYWVFSPLPVTLSLGTSK
jgi:carboxypeptidase D